MRYSLGPNITKSLNVKEFLTVRYKTFILCLNNDVLVQSLLRSHTKYEAVGMLNGGTLN